MSNNPYCLFCYETLGLNDGFNPEIKENIEIPIINNFGDNGHICINCLCQIINDYNKKYKKQLQVFYLD